MSKEEREQAIVSEAAPLIPAKCEFCGEARAGVEFNEPLLMYRVACSLATCEARGGWRGSEIDAIHAWDFAMRAIKTANTLPEEAAESMHKMAASLAKLKAINCKLRLNVPAGEAGRKELT